MNGIASLLLAALLLLALPTPQVVAAAPDEQRAAAASRLYFEGKALTARDQLIHLLGDSTFVDPIVRARTLRDLLEICTKIYDPKCAIDNETKYIKQTLDNFPASRGIEKQELARAYLLYANYAQLYLGQPFQDPDTDPDSAKWRYTSLDGPLYLDHESFVGNAFVARDDFAAADRAVDKAISYVASVENPDQHRYSLATSLSSSILVLMAVSETERAYGIYRVTGDFIAHNLPAKSLEAALFRYTEADLLEEVGDFKDSRKALDSSTDILRQIELDDHVRQYFISADLTLEAVVCVELGEMDCARSAVSSNPYAKLYETPGRKATSYAEVTYLTARALVAAVDNHPDSAVRSAIDDVTSPGRSMIDQRERIYRRVALALSLPAGAERDAKLAEVGALEVEVARRASPGVFGAWYRPGTIDQLITALALGRLGKSAALDDSKTFELFQLARRGDASFDADATTALARASTDSDRRMIHAGLRFRSRRDRLERQLLQQIVAGTGAKASTPTKALADDFLVRQRLRQFSVRIEAIQDQLAHREVAISGANAVSLHDFQTKLGPHEAALTVAILPSAAAYLCVRRDSFVSKTLAPIDWKRVAVDVRLLTDALTNTNPPSNTLDQDFPVKASQELYDTLLRPIEGCLRPRDDIVWLPGLSLTAVPLAVLLRVAPPRTPNGYDLSKADWLIRDHSISYAGAASVIVASRTARDRPRPELSFLGVGNPLLTGNTATGEARSAILREAAGEQVTALVALPDTEAELRDSARHFRNAKLLVGGKATKATLNSELLGSYRIISFATHGLSTVDGQGLPDPALVLTPVTAKEPSDDGLLTASEIADLDLSASFVALSACNTASLDSARLPEDLPALSSAFAEAGVSSTLGTLWSVDSETTRRIVSATFAEIGAHPDRGTAEDLADAQRAFLLSPPSQAYLHPRFWAAFIVLGDGNRASLGEPVAQVSASRQASLTSVDVIVEHGGEVLGVRRSGPGFLARFISAPDGTGHHGSGLRWMPTADEGWVHVNPSAAASRFVARSGSEILAGGFQTTGFGHWHAVLERFDARSGTLEENWSDADDPASNGDVLTGAQLTRDETIFLVAHAPLNLLNDPDAARLTARSISERGQPRVLFETRPPSGFNIDSATVTPTGSKLVITYTDRFADHAAPSYPEDDYDAAICWMRPTTWVEVRDLKTFALQEKSRLDDVVISAATLSSHGVRLAGSVMDSKLCDERATVFAVDEGGKAAPLYSDASIGSSDFTGVTTAANGAVCAVGENDYRIDFEAQPLNLNASLSEQQLQRRANERESGLAMCVLQNGRTNFVKYFDAGSDVYLNSVDEAGTKELLIGGSIGDRGVVLHLAIP